MDDLLGYYDKFFTTKKVEKEEEPFKCERCGEITEKLSNRQIYCEQCSKIVKKENDKERIRLKRSNIP